MSTDLDEHSGVSLNAAAIRCERCGDGFPAHQITGPHGYVQLCVSCIARLLYYAVHYHDRARKEPL